MSALSKKASRIGAMLQRHFYLLMGSWPRLVELLYWPTLNMIVWGFLNYYLSKQSSGVGVVAGVILSGALLWEILIRSQFSIMVPFLEELWSRNLPMIFVSPLPPLEYAFGLILLSLMRTFIALTPCYLLAKLFFGLWLPGIGWPLIAFYFNLALTGWWGGLLLIALLLRYGVAAEWLAWMASFILSPFVAVYYPVSILPSWIQHISWVLPPTYVFEGLRAIMNQHEIRADYMLTALILNLLYLAVAAIVYLKSFESTRRESGLLQTSAE